MRRLGQLLARRLGMALGIDSRGTGNTTPPAAVNRRGMKIGIAGAYTYGTSPNAPGDIVDSDGAGIIDANGFGVSNT